MKRTLLYLLLIFSFISYSQQTKIDSLEVELKTNLNPKDRAIIYESLAIQNFHLMELDEAKKWTDSLMSYANRYSLITKQASALKLKGSIKVYKNKFNEAIIEFDKAIDILSHESSNKDVYSYTILGDIYNNKAIAFMNLGESQKAEKNYLKAIEAYKVSENHKGLCLAYINLASIGLQEQNYTKAIKYTEEYTKQSSIYNSPLFMARGDNMFGAILAAQEEYENAIIYLKKADVFFEKSNYIQDYYYNLGELGTAYADNKQYNLSEKSLEKAIGIANKYEIVTEVSQIYKNSYISTLLSLKKYDKAYDNIEEIKKTPIFKKHLDIQSLIYSQLGRLYLERDNNIQKAEKHFKIALQKSIEAKDYNLEMDISKYLYDLYKKNGKNKRAIIFGDRYFKLNDSIKGTKLNKEIISVKEKYQTEKKEKENLQLKADNAAQQLQLEKENKQKGYLSLGLLASLLILSIFIYYYRRNKKQKDIIEKLQKELHHRVKNNLSIIDSLIEDIKDEFDNPKFTKKLIDLQNRIESINEVHKQLYKDNDDITNLKLKKYVEKLSNNVQQSFNKEHINIKHDIADNLSLNVKDSFPVGLIINEFITNSYKYAFNDAEKGIVTISVKEKEKSYILSLSDNGIGLPKGLNISNLDSFGLDVMQLLAKQLKGTFSLDGTNGVHLNIEFPK